VKSAQICGQKRVAQANFIWVNLCNQGNLLKICGQKKGATSINFIRVNLCNQRNLLKSVFTEEDFLYLSLMKYFKYQWFNFNIVISCDKCGGKIPMQQLDGNPTCEDCGHVASYTWFDTMKRFNVGEFRKNQPHKCMSMGEINGNLTSSKVGEVGCYHCGTQVRLNDQTELPMTCTNCSMDLNVKKLDHFLDLLFYTEVKSKVGMKPGGESMIAVRCAACGGPLKVDPTKEHYKCEFCHVDNVLPPAMRYKVVLNNLYVGAKYETFPKQLAFETPNPEVVKKVLRNVDSSKFSSEEIDKLATKFPQDAGILNIILTEYKLIPSNAALEQLWQESKNQQVFILAGPKMGKTQAETDARIQEFNPVYKKPLNTITNASLGSKSQKGIMWMIIIAVAAVVTVLCIKYLT
jgi:DNA-directed RNA polymerase subunit RPC12/RpoP